MHQFKQWEQKSDQCTKNWFILYTGSSKCLNKQSLLWTLWEFILHLTIRKGILACGDGERVGWLIADWQHILWCIAYNISRLSKTHPSIDCQALIAPVWNRSKAIWYCMLGDILHRHWFQPMYMYVLHLLLHTKVTKLKSPVMSIAISCFVCAIDKGSALQHFYCVPDLIPFLQVLAWLVILYADPQWIILLREPSLDEIPSVLLKKLHRAIDKFCNRITEAAT